MIVYQAYHKEKPAFYVGKTVKSLETRKRQHINESAYNRTNSIFHKAIRKYGADMFDWCILEVCETLEDLNAAEIKWIALVKECNHRLYNIAKGGNGGDMGGSKYWKKNGIRDDMKVKISNGLKRYYQDNEHPLKGTTHVGIPHTEESKKKMSESKKGHIVTSETREKLRDANLGKKLKPYVIEIFRDRFSGKNNPSAKKIICTTTGEVFDYAKLAAVKYKIDLSSIIKCCKGKQKTAKKLSFTYYPQGRKL